MSVEKNIQIQDLQGNSLFPRTKGKMVINSDGENLENVEAGAQANKIEKIILNGVELTIVNKTVSIETNGAEYTIIKQETAEDGYSSTYQLTKDGVPVGEKINIAKDMFCKEASVKICETANVPAEGYKVGDKYIDFVLANSENSHFYVLVSDLVDVYTAGTGIVITGNQISVDMTTLESTFATKTELENKADASAIPTKTSQLTNDSGFLNEHQDISHLATKTELENGLSAKANAATTLSGYGITDGLTYVELA